MSSKSTIFLTSDEEHCYFDCSEAMTDQQGERKDAITIEFSKDNIRVDCNDTYDLVVTIINPDSDLYKIFENLKNKE